MAQLSPRAGNGSLRPHYRYQRLAAVGAAFSREPRCFLEVLSEEIHMLTVIERWGHNTLLVGTGLLTIGALVAFAS